MARIREFFEGKRDVKPPQSEVDAYVQTVSDANGELFLYLYNYAAAGPQHSKSPTQSTHFDRNAAKAFKKILEDTFGPLWPPDLPATLPTMPLPSTIEALRSFVTARAWDDFHTPENLAKSISIESAELLELYQWTDAPDPQQVQDELADVITYCIHLANRLGVDIDEIVMAKLAKTEQKYPVELNQGTIHKRTEP